MEAGSSKTRTPTVGGGEGMNKIDVTVQAVAIEERLVQQFPYGETNQEHCIHGIKLRWSCDDCEDTLLNIRLAVAPATHEEKKDE